MQPWILFALGAAFFAALVTIFGKIGLQGIDSTLATTVRAVVMALFLVTVALAFGTYHGVGALVSSRAMLYIVLSGVAGALSWLCYFYALKSGPATAVAALDKASIVLVFVLAVLFLGEAFTWKHAAGALMVAAGAFLML